MAKSENDGSIPVTTATPASKLSTEKLFGLLGGELDLFGQIGLGMGASNRAKELVLKGLLYELIQEQHSLPNTVTRKKGRPKSNLPNKDVRRAAALLGADDLLRERRGKGAPTQKAALEMAQQIDKILCENDQNRVSLFGNTTEFKTFQDSVSKGLRELGKDGERFLKK